MAEKAAGEMYYDLDGQLSEIKRQLRQFNGYPYDSQALKRHLQYAIEGRFGIAKNQFLKLISTGEEIVIGPTDGTEILAKAKDIFTWIDSDFVDYGADEPGQATLETSVRVYEMAQNATFAQMFGSLSNDLDKLCLTQVQIKSFAKNHRNWLRGDGYATFFLFNSYGHFFVADVDVHSHGRLGAVVRRFEDAHVWSAEDRNRVVVP